MNRDLLLFGDPETSLHVRVSEECDRGSRERRRSSGIVGQKQVFIFVARRAMNHLHIRKIGQRDWPVRQILQPLQIVGGELAIGPDGSRRRNVVEAAHVGQPGAGAVMVAAHERVAESAGALNHFVRVRSISDGVAEIDDHIMRRSRRQAGFQCFQVCVNIA